MVNIPIDELEAMPLEGEKLILDQGSLVVELGNKKNGSGLYREFYESQGMRYVCLDWNGLDGAISFDFGKPIPTEVSAVTSDAALVTNFGFVEHVYTDQVQAWKNVNQLCGNIGCYLAMVMPTPGYWEHHGVYQPTLDWYREWLVGNGFEILTLRENSDRERYTYVIAGQRVIKRDEYYHPEGKVHITPREQRLDPNERAFGG